MAGNAPRTLAEKIWDAHVVRSAQGEPDLLYIDLHLLHEVTSPQAFDGLRMAGRPVRRPDLTIATEDHNTPTDNLLTIADPRAEHEPPLGVAGQQAVALQRDRDPVRRRTGEAGRLDQLRERSRAALQGGQNGNRLVEDADSARVVHVLNIAVSECETQAEGRRRDGRE